MRLVLFHPEFREVGGAEILAATQARAMQRIGHRVEIATFGHDPARWGAVLADIPVTEVARRSFTDVLALGNPVARLRRRARRAVPAFRGADVVLAGNYPCGTMLAAIQLEARKVWQCNEPPRALHLRESNPFLAARTAATGGRCETAAVAVFAAQLARREDGSAHARHLQRLAAFDRATVPGLDGIFAISAFSRENARRIYGRCQEETVPPIVRFPAAARRRPGLERAGLQVLVHSRLAGVKNVDTVLRGFARFREQECPGARMHVVGDGEARAGLEALAAELGAAGAVRFHGFLPEAELQRVREACDVLALLPIDEPFGMIFPEAAAQGLLLVGPDHGGPAEILDGGALGWTCDAFDPESLAEALARVWTTPDAEVDRRREEADRACRDRYAEGAVVPRLLRALS